jgi:hypothetical protein
VLKYKIVNMKTLAPKIGAIQLVPKTQNLDFPGKASYDSDSISVIYTDPLSK